MNYLKTISLTIISLLIGITVLSILFYYDIIKENIFNILRILLIMITFIINGYKIEKISTKKRANILYSITIAIILLLVNIIFSNISLKLLIYIIIIILSNFLGSFIYRKRKKT